MIDLLQRESVYLWFYFTVLFEQIAPYWGLGILIGSLISVFGKGKINRLLLLLQAKETGVLGVIPASLLGIASPLCMYGTIPIAASFSQKGMKDHLLAAFMMSSIQLNPQILIYSAALGRTAFIIRIAFSVFCGVGAGIFIKFFYQDEKFFDFSNFKKHKNSDVDPNIIVRFIKNFGRNIKATGGYFLLGIILTALFQRYVPANSFVGLFGNQRGFGVLMAATLGVPLYVCGGGTIPLLLEWLQRGMSMGSAAAFMITGPATKITNLGAVKIILGVRRFIFYILYVLLFSFFSGIIINLVL